MEEQKLKMARVFAEFIRLQTRSQHFLPVTGKAGEVIIPGIGSLGARHEMIYGVRPEHFGHMREALLYAIKTLLGKDYNDEIGRAWSETFDMLAGAMQKHAGENPGGWRLRGFSREGLGSRAPLWNGRINSACGVAQIDNEHKRLLVLLNELNRALQTGTGLGALGGVLDGLVDYAAYHFAHEEDQFLRSGYPAYEAHRLQHRALTARVKEIYAEFQSGAGGGAAR